MRKLKERVVMAYFMAMLGIMLASYVLARVRCRLTGHRFVSDPQTHYSSLYCERCCESDR